jgi:hypothetical protein
VEQPLTLSRQALWLKRTGVGLFLVAALLGFAIPHFTVPRLALSGHIVALDQERWPGITLHFKTPCVFGPTIRFLPAPTRQDRYGGQVYDSLAARVRAARPDEL